MGQKKVNKANDAFGLNKAKKQKNNKNDGNFGNKYTNRPNHQAALDTFLQQVTTKVKSEQEK